MEVGSFSDVRWGLCITLGLAGAAVVVGAYALITDPQFVVQTIANLVR